MVARTRPGSPTLAIRAAAVGYSRQLQSEDCRRCPSASACFIGLTTNIAARVQSLTRAPGTDILLTEAVREKLDPRFGSRPLAARPVKGVAEPVVTCAVEGAPAE